MDPAGIRSFMRRDWARIRESKREYWASCSSLQRIELGEELWHQAKATLVGWPDAVERAADLQAHCDLKRLIDCVNRAYNR